MSLIGELKRRNVFRVAVAYLVLGWLVLQVADVLVDALELPGTVNKTVIVLLAVGFIPTLIFSWVYEMTPEGLKRESDVTQEESITAHTAKKLDLAVLFMLALAIGLFAFDRFGRSSDPSAPSSTAAQPEADPVQPAPVEPPTPVARAPEAIAVLPFTDLSQAGDQGYFADGIAEEILNLLARIPDLRVIARTSAFKFRGEEHDLREVGRALNASHILEGSVRTAGQRVRITAQLIDADTNLHLWSQTYDRQLNDIFAVQDEIASAITEALGVELGIQGMQTTSHTATDTEAYRLYLRGRKAWAERADPGRLSEAIALLEQAVAQDPTLDAAYGTLALAHTVSPYYLNLPFESVVDGARANVERALALNPENLEALLSLAYVTGIYQFDDREGERLFKRALDIAPNDLTAVNLTGDFYRVLCEAEPALRYETKAVELDPLHPVQQVDLAWTYFNIGDWEQTLDHARQALALAPMHPDIGNAEIWSLVFLGRLPEARRRLDELQTLGNYNPARAAVDRLLFALAEGDEAQIQQQAEAAIAAGQGNDSTDAEGQVISMIGDLDAVARFFDEKIRAGQSVIALRSSLYKATLLALREAGLEPEFPAAQQAWLNRLLEGDMCSWQLNDALAAAGYPRRAR